MFAATARQCSKLQHNMTAVPTCKMATSGEHLAAAVARSADVWLHRAAANQQ
jgi:hypothetical protein